MHHRHGIAPGLHAHWQREARPIGGTTTFATEWNKIEATMSLVLELPTLVLLHNGVAAGGIFDRGAADVFAYEFDALSSDWPNGVRAGLAALRGAISS